MTLANNPIKMTALIVEDDPALRGHVANFLKQKNFMIFEAGNGEEAIELLQKHSQISIIVSDINMPRVDGRQLLKYVRLNSRSSITFVIMSGNINENTLLDLAKLGVDGILYKPFRASDLFLELENAMQRHRENESVHLLRALNAQ